MRAGFVGWIPRETPERRRGPDAFIYCVRCGAKTGAGRRPIMIRPAPPPSPPYQTHQDVGFFSRVVVAAAVVVGGKLISFGLRLPIKSLPSAIPQFCNKSPRPAHNERR